MIIGIVGFIGSGKGTVGEILTQEYGFTQMAFAGALKDAAANMFGWDRKLLEGDTKESRVYREIPDPFWTEALCPLYIKQTDTVYADFTPRLALQLLGTEAGREIFGDTLWISALKRHIDNLSAGVNKDFVVTDVRFPNEIDAINNWGGFVYRVRRGEEPEWYKLAEMQNRTPDGHQHLNENVGRTMQDKYPDVHFSEWAWVGSEFDGIIENDGSVADLHEKIEELIVQYAKMGLHTPD
jgi:hypothetical protein